MGPLNQCGSVLGMQRSSSPPLPTSRARLAHKQLWGLLQKPRSTCEWSSRWSPSGCRSRLCHWSGLRSHKERCQAPSHGRQPHSIAHCPECFAAGFSCPCQSRGQKTGGQQPRAKFDRPFWCLCSAFDNWGCGSSNLVCSSPPARAIKEVCSKAWPKNSVVFDNYGANQCSGWCAVPVATYSPTYQLVGETRTLSGFIRSLLVRPHKPLNTIEYSVWIEKILFLITSYSPTDHCLATK